MSYGKMGAQLHEPSDEHAYEFEQHMEENRTEDEPRDQQDDEGNETVGPQPPYPWCPSRFRDECIAKSQCQKQFHDGFNCGE